MPLAKAPCPPGDRPSAIDAILLLAAAEELGARLLQARVQRIGQPDEWTVTLSLRGPSEPAVLTFDLHPDWAYVGLRAERPASAPQPPRFCQLLRKHLEGARLTGCRSHDLQRVIEFTWQGRDETGLPTVVHLLAEFPGRGANLVLTDSAHRVLGWLRRPLRALVVGEPYRPVPLPAGRLDLWTALHELGPQGLEARLRALVVGSDRPADALARTTFGLQPYLWEALQRWTTGAAGWPGGPSPPTDLAEAAVALLVAAAARQWQPCLVHPVDGGPPFASPWPLPGHRATPQTSPLAALQAAAEQRAALLQQRTLRRQLQVALERARQRLVTRAAKQQLEWEQAERADRWRQAAELVLAHLPSIPRGVSEVSLPSFEDPSRLVPVPLDPARSAADNARLLWDRYRKARRAQDQVRERLEATKAELAFCEELRWTLEQASDEQELAAMRALLAERGWLAPADPGPRAAAPAKGSPPLALSLADGWRAWVGRNAAANDRLTFDLGREGDWWLHARAVPGSHVLLRPPAAGRRPPEDVLRAAAGLAAHFSAARDLPAVDVDLVPWSAVRKPAGAPPGFVTYRGERTLRVRPLSPEELAGLSAPGPATP